MATSVPLGPSQGPFVSYIGKNHGATSIDNLSLSNGMTAGWGVGDGQTQNPPLSANGAPFNPYGGNPNWPIQRVGILRNVPGTLSGGLNQQGQNALYFLYNPTQIEVQFSMDASQAPANYTYGGDPQFISVGATSLINSQTVSWTLLFDRTYDMLYGPDPGGNRGVLKDIGALYLVLGAFLSDAAVPFSTLVEVVFGQTDNGDLWGFTGFITGVDIQYGIFKHNMIPSRCSVGLSMTASYIGPQTPTSGGAGSGAPLDAAAALSTGGPVQTTTPTTANQGVFVPTVP